MITKRIIACLDIKDGRTVKGTNFINLKDAGDPVELAMRYADEGIDELVFLDISATNENRTTLVEMVRSVGQVINIPFSVGGGINDLNIAFKLLQNGADKISVNSSAIKKPEIIREISDAFGVQCMIVAVDAKCVNCKWQVHINGGKQNTGIDLFDWVCNVEQLGAGEILFTSMDHDGTKNGYAVEALKKMNSMLSIPIIASGGAGKKEHFLEVLQEGVAEAALAASIFHYKEVEVQDLKKYLFDNKISVRYENI